MDNPNLHGKITLDFTPNHPANRPGTPSSTYYTLTYRGSLPQFYENTIISKLLAHIVDFSINEASHQAFIRLESSRPLTFFDRYEFVEGKEVWKFEGSMKEMSTKNRYRYFEGKYIRNDEHWVKERVAKFASRSGWNFQDLLYYEDEYYEGICENLWAEEAKQLGNTQNRGHKALENDMNAEDDDWNGNNNGDSGLKIVLSDKGSEADVLSEKNNGVMEEESKGDDEDFDSLGLKCIKKVKIVTSVGRTENLEDSPDTGLEHDGPLDVSLKEDGSSVKPKCTSSNGDSTSDECDGFPAVAITIGTWNFDNRNEPIVDKASKHMPEGLNLKDIAPIRVKGDMHILGMYGYTGQNTATSESAKC